MRRRAWRAEVCDVGSELGRVASWVSHHLVAEQRTDPLVHPHAVADTPLTQRRLDETTACGPGSRSGSRSCAIRSAPGSSIFAELLAAGTGAASGAAEPFVAAVALVAVVRAAFEAPATDRPGGRQGAVAGLRLLRSGQGGYAIATRR
jgi:hypothetical protein